jgi:asparagine synthase (glutamine-hydrolysing)
MHALRLYRDRLGVKPLYWTKTDAGFLFGSEIKSLLAAGLPRKVNFEAMHHFLSFNYVPHPLTMFDGIQSLEAGSRMDVTIDGQITTTQFWNLPTDSVGKDRSELEIQNDILTLLEDATSIRLRSDVEVGAFLSGGLDSSSVVGVASQFTQDRI